MMPSTPPLSLPMYAAAMLMPLIRHYFLRLLLRQRRFSFSFAAAFSSAFAIFSPLACCRFACRLPRRRAVAMMYIAAFFALLPPLR